MRLTGQKILDKLRAIARRDSKVAPLLVDDESDTLPQDATTADLVDLMASRKSVRDLSEQPPQFVARAVVDIWTEALGNRDRALSERRRQAREFDEMSRVAFGNGVDVNAEGAISRLLRVAECGSRIEAAACTLGESLAREFRAGTKFENPALVAGFLGAMATAIVAYGDADTPQNDAERFPYEAAV